MPRNYHTPISTEPEIFPRTRAMAQDNTYVVPMYQELDDDTEEVSLPFAPMSEPGLQNVSLDFIPFGMLGKAANKPVIKANRAEEIELLNKQRNIAQDNIIEIYKAPFTKNQEWKRKALLDNEYEQLRKINQLLGD